MISRLVEWLLVALGMAGLLVSLVLSLMEGGWKDRTKGAPSEECPGCSYMRFVGCICTKCGHSDSRPRVRMRQDTARFLAELAEIMDCLEAPGEAPRRKPRGRST